MKCSKKRKKKKKKHKTACQHFNCKPCSWIIKSERQDCAYGCLFISPYGAELCAAFLHLHRHPGRHQNALLILAAPRHKSASGKTDPKMHRENTRAATTRGALRFSAEFAPQKGGCLFFFWMEQTKKNKNLKAKWNLWCAFLEIWRRMLTKLAVLLLLSGLVGVKGPMVAD